jgi:hypothetical protein
MILQWFSETVTGGGTDNALAKRKKEKKRQAMFNKTLHGGLQIEQHGPLISGLNSLLQNGKQLLFH